MRESVEHTRGKTVSGTPPSRQAKVWQPCQHGDRCNTTTAPSLPPHAAPANPVPVQRDAHNSQTYHSRTRTVSLDAKLRTAAVPEHYTHGSTHAPSTQAATAQDKCRQSPARAQGWCQTSATEGRTGLESPPDAWRGPAARLHAVPDRPSTRAPRETLPRWSCLGGAGCPCHPRQPRHPSCLLVRWDSCWLCGLYCHWLPRHVAGARGEGKWKGGGAPGLLRSVGRAWFVRCVRRNRANTCLRQHTQTHYDASVSTNSGKSRRVRGRQVGCGKKTQHKRL